MAEGRICGFNGILGNEPLKEYFKKAIMNGTVSHAYILSGDAGMGKRTVASAFAMTLLCERGGAEPCMECHSCRLAMAGTHPDIIHVTSGKGKKIGVDDIRDQVHDTVMIRPFSSKYKIYIIDKAESLTPAAQGALLKTLEEPPAYVVIILISASLKEFLPTILSRCLQLEVKPLSDETVKDYLMENLHVPERDARIFSAFARGNLGKAIRLASSDEFKELYRKIICLIKEIGEMDVAGLLDNIRDIKEAGYDVDDVLDLLQLWYRDVLMFKVTKDMNLLIFKDEYALITDMGQKIDYTGLENILNAITTAHARLQANVNMELVLELLLLTIKKPS